MSVIHRWGFVVVYYTGAIRLVLILRTCLVFKRRECLAMCPLYTGFDLRVRIVRVLTFWRPFYKLLFSLFGTWRPFHELLTESFRG